MEGNNYQSVLKQMALICSKREYCCFDVEEKLKYKKLSEKEKFKIIDFLIEEKFIDESRFCEAFVKDKCYLNKWGKNKIRFHLRQKKITSSIIDKALKVIDTKIYEEQLYVLVKNKSKSIKAEHFLAFKQKLIRFLIQRGYEMDLILSVLDQNIDWIPDTYNNQFD